MAVEAGSQLAQAIQAAVQPKLMEEGWVAEENDTTLSEYVTMMIVNGKDMQGVQAELGGDLLGVGEDDPAVGQFAQWLFDQVRSLQSAQQSAQQPASGQQNQQQSSTGEDEQMGEASSTTAEGAPSAPRALRNGGERGRGRGRGGRMLGQMNTHMDRNSDLPDSLRRIRGAAGSGPQGRINSHAGRDVPRGPRGSSIANGMARAMNGAGRGGAQGGAMNPMMQQQMMNSFDPSQQMAFMQMMEMSASFMQQMMNNGGQMPGGRGGKTMFDRTKGPKGRRPRQQTGDSQGNGGTEGDDNSMEVDGDKERKNPFDSVCRFNANCTNANCAFAHQSPAAPPGITIDLSDTCSYGVACENRKCAGRHPSPAQRGQHLKEVDCKFYPNCTNQHCPFRHPDMPLCRNGADCNVAGCKFTHSKIMCKFTPCSRSHCPFKHVEGQRGVFKDKVWTKDGVPDLSGEQDAASKANRFAGLEGTDGPGEELIIPGQHGGAAQVQQQPQEQQQTTMTDADTQIE